MNRNSAIISIIIGVALIGIVISAWVTNQDMPQQIIQDEGMKKHDNPELSTLFRVFAYEKDIKMIDGESKAIDVQFELKPELQQLYDQVGLINDEQNTVVILPIFTSSTYYEPGFYTYYTGECDTTCLTTTIEYDKPLKHYTASQIGAKVLAVLGYKTITDIDVDKKPSILSDYDKVILLHNEYVTRNEFEAITNHPNVIYLYPNALHAEVKVDYENDEITLIRGHGYPTSEDYNGFDWEYDNTQPYEFDSDCVDWFFYPISNGKMLSCYPDHLIRDDAFLLKAIKESDDFWGTINSREKDDFNEKELEMINSIFNLLPR